MTTKEAPTASGEGEVQPVAQVQALEDAMDAARFVAIYSSAFTEEVSDAFCAELEKFGNRPTLDQYRAAIDAAIHSKEPKNG